MAVTPYPIQCKRDNKWVAVQMDELMPGDMVSIDEQSYKTSVAVVLIGPPVRGRTCLRRQRGSVVERLGTPAQGVRRFDRKSKSSGRVSWGRGMRCGGRERLCVSAR